MAQGEKATAGRRKRREKQEAKREKSGDTPQAAAEQSKAPKQEYDPALLRQLGARTGLFG